MGNAANWTPESRERYNRAVGNANAYRAECEALMAKGVLQDAPEFKDKETAWTRALDEADAIAAQADALVTNAERTAAHDATRNAPTTTPVVSQQPGEGDPQTDDGLTPWKRNYNRFSNTPEYKRSFDGYVRSVAVPQGFANRERDTLQEGVDTMGGYLVPADIVPGIYRRMAQTSVLWGLVSTRETLRDRIVLTRVQPASGTDEQIYSSAFIGSWVSESPGSSDGLIDPVFGRIEIPVKKARTKTFISMDELADSETDILAFLQDDGGGNLGLVADKGFINGSGAAAQPMGILNSPDAKTKTDVSGTTTHTISNTTGNRGSADQLLALQYDLPPQYSGGASWLVHRKVEQKIRVLVDGQNRYIWAAGFADKPNELLGYPVNRSDFMPLDGTTDNIVLAFGNWAEAYVKVLRQAVAVQVDPYTKAENDLVTVYLRMRVGGDVRNPDAYRLGYVHS